MSIQLADITKSELIQILAAARDVETSLNERDLNEMLTLEECNIVESVRSQKLVVLLEIKKKLVHHCKSPNGAAYKMYTPKIIKALTSGFFPLIADATHLDCSNIALSNSMTLFEKLPRGLEHLDVSRCGLTDQGLIKLFQVAQTLPNLTSLNIKGNKCSTHGTAVLASMLPRLKLTALDCSDCCHHQDLVYAVSPTMYSFDVYKNAIKGDQITWKETTTAESKEIDQDQHHEKPLKLKGVVDCIRSLKKLTMSNIQGLNFKHLNQSSCTTIRLHNLDLNPLPAKERGLDAATPIEEEQKEKEEQKEGDATPIQKEKEEEEEEQKTAKATPIQEEHESIENKNIVHLTLKQCVMDTKFVTSIFTNLENNDNMITLDLSYSNITNFISPAEFGALLFTYLPQSKLKDLNMMYCGLTDVIAIELCKAVPLTKDLTSLNVKGNAFTYHGLTNFANMFESNDVYDCQLIYLDICNGFAPNLPSVGLKNIASFTALDDATKAAYSKHFTSVTEQDRLQLSKLFLSTLASRKTPTKLLNVKGISLNLTDRYGKEVDIPDTSDGIQSFAEFSGDRATTLSSQAVKNILTQHNIAIADCHRIMGKDNKQMLVYLKYTHQPGEDRKNNRAMQLPYKAPVKEELAPYALAHTNMVRVDPHTFNWFNKYF